MLAMSLRSSPHDNDNDKKEKVHYTRPKKVE